MKEEDINLLKATLAYPERSAQIQEIAERYSKAGKNECRELLKALLKIMDSPQQLPSFKLQAAKIIEACAETKNPRFVRILGKGLKFYKEFAKYKAVRLI